MTALHAGEIGRQDEAIEILDSDDLMLLREGVLLRVTAELLAAYIVAENTTVIDVDDEYNVNALDDFISGDATSASFDVNLLPLSTVPIKPIYIKKIAGGANTVTIVADGSDTIDGAATEVISSDGIARMLVPFPTEWRLF